MITLLPSSGWSVGRMARQSRVAPVEWAYFGASVRKRLAVTSHVPGAWQQVSFGGRLKECARSLRKAYIDYIGQLGVEHDSLDWWFSSLSEKNPSVSKAFLHICYVAVAVDLCRDRKVSSSLVLIVERPEVRKAIAASLRERNIPYVERGESPASRVAATAKDWAEMAMRRAYWVSRQTMRILVARAMGFTAEIMHGEGERRPWLLLHNWVDGRSFPADEEYKDLYFGRLREELQKRGVPVAVVATVLSHAPYARLIGKLKKTGIPLLIPEAALTLPRLLRWFGSLSLRPPRRRARPRFEGLDVADILTEVERRDWINQRAADVRMTLDIAARWCRRIDVRAFIYPYEGHIWERGYCHAFHHLSRRVKLIGYQHATVSPFWLNHFIAKAEWGKVPFPDRIVTNGPYHYSLFRRNDIPEPVLSSGGAFRYDGLGEEVPRRLRSSPLEGSKKVLIAPSIIPSTAADLLRASIEAFQCGSHYQVVLKCHPRLPASRVAEEAGVRTLPDHFVIDDRPIMEVLPEADVVVYSDSSIALEALAQGIPVVHYSPCHEIDLDPLEDFPELRPSADSVLSLKAAVCELRTCDPEARDVLARRAREAIRTIFAKPDATTVALFIPEPSRDVDTAPV